MQYHEIVGKVQHQAHLASEGEAVRALQATLKTLGERLYGEEGEHLAAQLPNELGTFLTQDNGNQTYTLDEFLARVAEREGVDLPEAVHHARVVISVISEAVTTGEIEDVRAQLPETYQPLFEAGSEGEMDIPS